MSCSVMADVSVKDDDCERDFLEFASECLQTRPGNFGWTVGEHVGGLRSRGIVTEMMAGDRAFDDPVSQIAAARPRLMRLARDVSFRVWRRYRSRHDWLQGEERGRDFRQGVFLGFLHLIADTASRSLSGEPLQSLMAMDRAAG